MNIRREVKTNGMIYFLIKSLIAAHHYNRAAIWMGVGSGARPYNVFAEGIHES